VVIGIHGTISKEEVINFVPSHNWKNKDLKGDIEKEVDLPIQLENNANLCSIAERVYMNHQSDNVLSISMYSGIGIGMIFKGELLKGSHGYAGEMGHMIIVPDGKPCNCGNLGCWGLYASEQSFFHQVNKHFLKRMTYEEIHQLIIVEDKIIMKQFEEFIKYLSIGLNNIVNILNPETLVLNSELLKLYPDAENKIKSHLKSSVSHYNELFISELGNKAAIMGACALAIKNFMGVSDLRLRIER
jgi:predicted NBD/HSP70 family sugar kinase